MAQILNPRPQVFIFSDELVLSAVLFYVKDAVDEQFSTRFFMKYKECHCFKWGLMRQPNVFLQLLFLSWFYLIFLNLIVAN